jgi:hypothetical protein
MIPRYQATPRQSAAEREAKAYRNLLCQARIVLGKMLTVHIDSVAIGQLEPIADSGVIADEVRRVRNAIEEADRLCADIDRDAKCAY